MKKGILILFGFILLSDFNYGQALKNEEKIDHVFRQLIAASEKAKIVLVNKKRVTNARKTVVERKVLENEVGQDKYECIVYTKGAKALKNKGIVINSTLPTFVTAVATLKQIEEMASMTEVTYIEAPKMNYPTQPYPKGKASKKVGTE